MKALYKDKLLFGSTTSMEDIVNTIYPVGSIYMSINNVNPSVLFGGTWVAWGSGRVPVGVSSDTEFSTVEKTGGEKAHTLAQSELPITSPEVIQRVGVSALWAFGHWGTNQGPADYWLNYPGQNNTTGNNQAHNNLQPYITCYMWKRTA